MVGVEPTGFRFWGERVFTIAPHGHISEEHLIELNQPNGSRNFWHVIKESNFWSISIDHYRNAEAAGFEPADRR